MHRLEERLSVNPALSGLKISHVYSDHLLPIWIADSYPAAAINDVPLRGANDVPQRGTAAPGPEVINRPITLMPVTDL